MSDRRFIEKSIRGMIRRGKLTDGNLTWSLVSMLVPGRILPREANGYYPDMMGCAEVAVYVIPPGVDQFAVIIDAGMELIGFMPAYWIEIATIGIHRKQGRHRFVVSQTTASVAHFAAF